MKINVKDIKAAPYNPRVITAEEKTGLENSIKKFDDISGITFNIRTGNLVTGHQRWASLNEKYRDLNFKQVQIADKKSEAHMGVYDGEEFLGFVVRVVNWPEEKEKAANVAANAHTIQGKFDLEALSLLLTDIELDLKTELRLDKLELDLGLVGGDWDTDLGKIEKTEENLDGIEAKITVMCQQHDKDDISAAITKGLTEAGFIGFTVK